MPQLVEFRIPVPLSIDEFERAWLFMCLEASCFETSNGVGGGEGVVVLKNEPYDNTQGQMGEISELSGQPIPRTKGQYTHKEYRFASRAPSFIRAVLPTKSLILVEESFNAYPMCTTFLTNAWLSKNKFYVKVTTRFAKGNCTEENIIGLSKKQLKTRRIINIDLANQDKNHDDYREKNDPTLFSSTTTSRGQLVVGEWMKTSDPVMTAYKVVEVCCASFWPAGGKAENSIINAQEDSFAYTHASAFTTIDSWIGLTMKDIRILEALLQEILENEVTSTSAEGGEEDNKKKKKKKRLSKSEKALEKERKRSLGNPLFDKIMQIFYENKTNENDVLGKEESSGETKKTNSDATATAAAATTTTTTTTTTSTSTVAATITTTDEKQQIGTKLTEVVPAAPSTSPIPMLTSELNNQ